jgi:YggT family protein
MMPAASPSAASSGRTDRTAGKQGSRACALTRRAAARRPTRLEAGARVRDDGDVLAIQFVLYYALFFFWLLLLARIVAEMVRSFARQWVPVGPSAVALEVIFTVTDPPVKLLRRVIPVVRIGGVGLDLSIMVLLLVVFILMSVAQP